MCSFCLYVSWCKVGNLFNITLCTVTLIFLHTTMPVVREGYCQES